MNLPGQILPDSPFGRVLTELASKSQNILEVGTWKGGGSTRCIANGMSPTSTFTTVEANQSMYKEFRNAFYSYIHFGCMYPLYGVLHRSIQPLACHPDRENIQVQECWDFENEAILAAPIYGLHWDCDLVLLDGGEFTSAGDFQVIYPHANRWIALDDTNPKQVLKNVFARETLLKMGWTVVNDCLHDRHGWAVFEKP